MTVFRLLDRVQRTRSISKLNSFGFCSLYRRTSFALMYNFQKLNCSGELSYIEGEVEVVSPDHDASDYFESQRERCSKF